MKNKVFLGGTYNSTWREELIPLLKIPYFNPIVPDWTPESQKIEREEKKKSKVHLYYITAEITWVCSVAKAVESAMTRGVVTFFAFNPEEFKESQVLSLLAVSRIIIKHGGRCFCGCRLEYIAEEINNARITCLDVKP